MAITLACPILTSSCRVVLPDVEQLPASRPVRTRQNVFETDAGEIAVYTVGASSVSVFNLILYPLTFAEAEAIKSFFASAPPFGVSGRAKTWQLQDSRGEVYTVRFQQDVIEPIQKSPNSWSVHLTVRGVA